MLTIRCFKCRWAWSMNPAQVGAALDTLHSEQHSKYYMAECPNCRRANKVAVKQLRRNAPRDWKPSPPASDAAPASDKQKQAESKGAKPRGKAEAGSKPRNDAEAPPPKKTASKSKSK